MKRYLLLLLILAVLFIPINAMAAPSPLDKVPSSTAVAVNEQGQVQVVSYDLQLTAETDFIKANASVVIKNTNGEADTSFFMGMPAFFNEDSIKVSLMEVRMDGKKQGIANRKNRTKPEDTSIKDLPANWLVWTVNLKPNESKVVDIIYHLDIQQEANGTRSIYIPLEYLRPWSLSGGTKVKVAADLGQALPYIFEPNPSVLPKKYDNEGRLSWEYNDSTMPDYILLYYRPIEAIVTGYLNVQAPGDRQIGAVIQAFSSKSYEAAISDIDKYMEAQPDTNLKNELLFLKALSYKALYQFDKAMPIYDQLERIPLFNDLEGTIKNNIVYDKYNYLKANSASDAVLYEYLENAKAYVMGNALFLKWIEQESGLLTPPPTPTPEPTPVVEEPVDKTDKPEPEDNVIKYITVAGKDIPVEYLFIGIILFVIILALLFRKKKPKRRGYMFR